MRTTKELHSLLSIGLEEDETADNPGIGWALGKIYRDHLKLPVPDYLATTFPEIKETASEPEPTGQKEQI